MFSSLTLEAVLRIEVSPPNGDPVHELVGAMATAFGSPDPATSILHFHIEHVPHRR